MGAQDLVSAINAGITQSERLLKLDTPLGEDVLLPQRVAGTSRIGRNFEFTVDAVSLRDSLELKTLIAQPVTLWIQTGNKSYLPHHGYVYTARRLGSDGSLTTYQFTLSSWMHFLRFRKDARIFQDKAVDEILATVFNGHPQAQGAFRFDLRKALSQRSFCVQYEDDWNFCQRLMESEGLFGYFEHADDGESHTLVITDDVYSLKPAVPQTVQFARAGTNTFSDAWVQWAGSRTLHSSSLSTKTFDYKSPGDERSTNVPTLSTHGSLPAQAEVYEYTGAYTHLTQDRGDHLSKIRMEEWESRAKRFMAVGGVRNIDAGKWFQLEGHPEHDKDAEQQRQFAVIATHWYIENNLPVSTTADFPHSLRAELSRVRAAHEGAAPAFGRVDVDVWFHEIYRDLINSMYSDTDELGISLVRSYLDKWYPAMSAASWHDGHLKANTTDGGAYVGYWAIEAAAAAYLIELDDISLRDHLLYPKDLVDFAREFDAGQQSQSGALGTGPVTVRTGQVCPETGIWKARGHNVPGVLVQKGDRMPEVFATDARGALRPQAALWEFERKA
ncbi:type VI secretion system tip protein TssI/VgrG [Paraburkholderia sp. SIMBA_061]